MRKAIIIGSGFAGLSAASFLAKAGWEVTVIEKHNIPGGRARNFKEKDFVFDMGPSWYWMPDVFERYFKCFGKKVSEYYRLQRLDPSYRIYWDDGFTDMPANYTDLNRLFDEIEPGSGALLDKFLKEAEYKYAIGIKKLVYQPGRSLIEFLDIDVIKGIFKMQVFTSVKRHISKKFSSLKLKQILEFPVLFLGALPEKTPALYTLMNYADMKLGTWYPSGGIYKVVDSMYKLAEELNVKFCFDHSVKKINFTGRRAKGVTTSDVSGEIKEFDADVIVASADYHFIENELLPPELRSYSKKYWASREMAPGCLLYYVGLNKKLKNILHHSLFFDVNFKRHAEQIYKSPQWPDEPLFYVSATSVTDKASAPEGCENLFFLIPVAAGLQGDSNDLRELYFDKIIKRFEERIGEPVKESIIFKKTFGPYDFINEYNAFKGNAYGLANTLMQTAVLKPACRSKKVKNLFFTGQLTVPGPGVPPALISGEVVAGQVIKYFG